MAYSIEKSHISEDEPKVLSLQLLKEVTNDFSEERKLGSGTYGDVYKGVLNGEEIAVKVLRLIPRDDFHEQFKREFENLWRLKHRNIVRLLGYCYETKTQYVDFRHGAYVFADKVDIALCFEYMHNRSLGEHLYDEYNGHDWQTRYKIIKGICEGLKYLHEGLERPMYHLDLKPENILLDKTMLPKIADFGLSRLVHNDQTKATRSSAGTSGYMPPEYIHTNLISKKFDIFSLGVVVIRIIVGYKGYFKKADLSSQEFINLACENWRKRLQETSSRTMVEAQCHQVKRCIEIALDCVDADRNKRPPIGYIVRNLKELEPMIDTTAMSQMQRISITEEPGDNSTEGLQALSLNSSSRKFSSLTVPEKLPSSSSGKPPLDLVIVYAFDCFHQKTTTFYTVDDGVFWMVHEKLTHFVNSCMGYICLQLTNNMYWSDMKLVNSAETRETGYNHITERLITCTKNMACGLPEAHKMISNRGYQNGIILLFSDGMIHEGDFFDGAENFISNVPVHTFTLGGDAYNHVLQAMAENSPGGTFNPLPVPERPQLSESFSSLMDKILWDTMALSLNRCSRKFSSLLPVPDKLPISSSGKPPLDLVIVYAFDCLHQKNTTFYTVDDGVFWMVHEKLTHFVDSCMGYICIQLTNNMYWSDMKLVDSAETRETGYNHITEHLITCTKNMACGLPEAHKMISNRGYQNGIILLFSDGLIHKGDFFDGVENFVSNVPVHTFTLGGDAYNHVLQAMSKNSPGGTFNPLPVPERPQLSKSFSRLLDKILTGTMAG